jgi:hypothetical protein
MTWDVTNRQANSSSYYRLAIFLPSLYAKQLIIILLNNTFTPLQAFPFHFIFTSHSKHLLRLYSSEIRNYVHWNIFNSWMLLHLNLCNSPYSLLKNFGLDSLFDALTGTYYVLLFLNMYRNSKISHLQVIIQITRNRVVF